MSLAAQRPAAPLTQASARPSPGSHNLPVTGSRFFVPSSRTARPVAVPARPMPRRTSSMQPPAVSSGMERQVAEANMPPAAEPVHRPDPPLIIPPAPPAPSADPAALAVVDFRQGKLTVAANNANLGRVLKLIGRKTGAEIEIPPELATEPVVVRLGPGSPSEVLAALLNSPRLDFIVLGSDEQGQLQRVVVRKRASFGREPLAPSPAPQPQQNKAPEQH